MKPLRFFLFSFLLIPFANASAQAPPGVPKAAAYTIKGQVVNTVGNVPVQFATVSILKAADSTLVTGALAGEDGRYTIDGIPSGEYLIKAAFIGFSTGFDGPVQVGAEKPVATIPPISLSEKSLNAREVVVTGERPVMTLGIDRKTFDVTRMNLNPGGAAVDVLQNIPTVSVDGDGNVSLRNNENVTIYIDGRPSGINAQNRTQVLRQIPATAIERIELITSPSARYDAEGVSGIINIILKKNKLEGLNGSVQVGAGTRPGTKYNASGNLNYRNKRMNAYVNYAFFDNTRWGRGTSLRDTRIINPITGQVDSTFRTVQNLNSDNRGRNHFVKAGSDFFLNRNRTIGFSAAASPNLSVEDERIRYQYLSPEGGLLRPEANRHTVARSNSLNLDATANYRKQWPKNPGHELVLDASASDYRTDNTTNYTQLGQLSSNPDSGFINSPSQRSTSNSRYRTAIGQFDYLRPISSTFKTETGIKTTFRDASTDFRYLQSVSGEALTEVVSQHNDFHFTEQTLAAYAQVNHKPGKLGYQAGVRVEHTAIRATLRTTGASFPQNYLYFFPTLNVSYRLTQTADLQGGYRRSINRPGGQSLNPFTDFTDPLTLRTGNPALKPELIDNYELTWAWNPTQHSVSLTGFYRQTNQLQTRVITNGTDGRAVVRMANAGTRYDEGVEGVGRYQVMRGWALTGSGSVFASQIDAPLVSTGIVRRNVNWRASLLNTTQLSDMGLSFTLGAFYRSPFILPQGTSRPFYNVDASISQEVLKKRGIVSLAVTDIFNTLRFGIIASDQTFTQDFKRKRETRIATLTFTYRFGSMDNLSKRKESRQGGQGGGGDFGF